MRHLTDTAFKIVRWPVHVRKIAGNPFIAMAIKRRRPDALCRGLLQDDCIEPITERQACTARCFLRGLSSFRSNAFDAPRKVKFHAHTTSEVETLRVGSTLVEPARVNGGWIRGSVLRPRANFLLVAVNKPLTFFESAPFPGGFESGVPKKWVMPPISGCDLEVIFSGRNTRMPPLSEVARLRFTRVAAGDYVGAVWTTNIALIPGLDRAGARTGAPARSGGSDSFTIGELARECGVTLRALRFYQSKGLLTPQRNGRAVFLAMKTATALP